MSSLRPRQVIDYALARRAALADLFAGRASTLDVCDAHPYLLRAARHHGEASGELCPVCRRGRDARREPLTHVTYVYADAMGPASGRARSTATLQTLARHYPGMHVYVVEVCTACGWNHLVSSYVLGTRQQRAAGGQAASGR